MKIDVLDKGYVRLVDTMGTDLSVVNAARVSYDKESQEFDGKDEKLLNFLVRERHTAPFRHAIISLECYAPLIVKNQWYKHLIGGIYSNDSEFPGLDPFFAWNESSRRYVTENEEFALPAPNEWRSAPANKKQGSGDLLPVGPPEGVIRTMEVNFGYGADLTAELERTYLEGAAKYQQAMAAGVAPEQARLFLPAYGLYVRWRWTTSLQGLMWFLELRDDAHAQHEIREYAKALKQIAAVPFPVSIGSIDA
jgi:thymidylate synthase (FAD)